MTPVFSGVMALGLLGAGVSVIGVGPKSSDPMPKPAFVVIDAAMEENPCRCNANHEETDFEHNAAGALCVFWAWVDDSNEYDAECEEAEDCEEADPEKLFCENFSETHRVRFDPVAGECGCTGMDLTEYVDGNAIGEDPIEMEEGKNYDVEFGGGFMFCGEAPFVHAFEVYCDTPANESGRMWMMEFTFTCSQCEAGAPL